MTAVADPRPAGRPESIEARAERALRTVLDPELALDVVSLGLIYDLRVDPSGNVEVDMTLTTPGCPVSELLPTEVQDALAAELGPEAVTVNVVWEPPWSPERLSEEAKADLGFG